MSHGCGWGGPAGFGGGQALHTLNTGPRARDFILTTEGRFLHFGSSVAHWGPALERPKQEVVKARVAGALPAAGCRAGGALGTRQGSPPPWLTEQGSKQQILKALLNLK